MRPFFAVIIIVIECALWSACGYQVNSYSFDEDHRLNQSRPQVHNLTPYPELPLIVERAWSAHVHLYAHRAHTCRRPLISVSLSERTLTWSAGGQSSVTSGVQTRMLFMRLSCSDVIKVIERAPLVLTLDGHYADVDALTLVIDESIARALSKLD